MTEKADNRTGRIRLPDGSRLVLSSSPHTVTGTSVRRIMLKVMLALVPAVAAGVIFFGWRALAIVLLCVFSCVTAEALWCRMTGKPALGTVGDCSAAVTGMLLGMNLPPSIPLWVCPAGAVLAVILAKQIFGGLGGNPFNPALVARVGLLIALPAGMTLWPAPRHFESCGFRQYAEISPEYVPNINVTADESTGEREFITGATPLGVAGATKKIIGKNDAARQNFSEIDNCSAYMAYFIGQKGGCIGETSVLALLAGAFFLLCCGIIRWEIPVCFMAGTALLAGTVHFFAPGVTPSPVFHLLTGGLMLGACFMATDMVTSPMTRRGGAVFGFGCGLLTAVIRIWGNYPEGVSFSILLMNATVPFIDKMCSARPFGFVRKRERTK